MNPKIWGPHLWVFLDTIVFEYPTCPTNTDKNNMKNFIDSLRNILPCYKCQANFVNHLKIYPLNDHILSSKKKLIEWLINIHNEVNKSTGKKELEIKEVMEIWRKRYTPSINYKLLITIILIIFIILIIPVLIYFRL